MSDSPLQTPPTDSTQTPAQVLVASEELSWLWQATPSPDLDAFLAEAEPLSPAELAAVLRVDQRHRWELGERIPAERYLERFPKLLADQESTLDFIYSELLLREKQGEHPDLEGFLARFPTFAEILRRQVGLHRALCSESLDSPADAQTSVDSVVDGTVGGKYQIVRELGRGGTGVVYEARQSGVNRIVALKLLSAGRHAGIEQLARFRAEAELVGRLQHPHIVQIYEAGQQDGFPFLALEFMSGGSLRNRISGAPQSPEGSARLIEALARAVHAAHQAGVVHRDLKPGNVLFTSETSEESRRRAPDASWSASEIPKIADFGLAKALSVSAEAQTSDSLTRTGDILGTPSYMSPEQAAGRTDQIGPATDIYALGAILYELLTGRPPFQGVTVLETLQHLAADEPVPPSRLQPRLARDLEVICLKCLQKQPGQRYATALDLAEDLRRYLTALPIVARPISRIARLGRWCRRNPVPASLGGLVALLAGSLVIGSLVATFNLKQIADDRRAEALLSQARAVRLTDRLGRREQSRELLAEAARLRPGPQVRDEAIAGMAVFDLPVAGRAFQTSADVRWLDFDARLARYVREERSGLTIVSQIAGDMEICRLPKLLPHATLLLSPLGKYLSARSGASVGIWLVDGTNPSLVQSEPCYAVYGAGAVAFSCDDGLVAIGRPDGTVVVNSLPPGTFRREWKFDWGAAHLAFHPRQSQIAIAGRDGVQIRDYESGRLLVRLEESAAATWLAWHPEGSLLATADADWGITLWDPVNVRRQRKLRGHDSTGLQLRFNSTGTMLCSTAWDGVTRLWDTRDGSLVMATNNVTELRCAADRELWTDNLVSGRVVFLQADAHEVYTRLAVESFGSSNSYVHLAISRHGIARKRLLAVATKQHVRFWDLTRKRTIGFLPIAAVSRVHFDDRGTLWTSSPAGIQRWSIQESTDEPGTLYVGPAVNMVSAGGDGDFSTTPDGCSLVCGGMNGAFVWHAERPDVRVPLQGHLDPRYASLSPDGRWIATGSHTDSHVKIWDARTGALARTLEMPGSRVEFSADGKWLATTGGGLALWTVGEWDRAWGTEGPCLSGPAFGAGGQIVAGENGTGAVVLYETVSGRELARLTDPYGQRQIFLVFSPDDRYLAGISYNFKNLCVWDLREIDNRLKELGVPWQWRSSPALPADKQELSLLKIVGRLESRSQTLEKQLEEVTEQLDKNRRDEALHFRRGNLLIDLDRPSEAIDELTQAIGIAGNADSYSQRSSAYAAANDYFHAIADATTCLGTIAPQDPRQGLFCNQLAWYYVISPEGLRQPSAAVKLARRALRHEPGRASYLNTLGVALCRNGDWDEAADALRGSLKVGSDSPASDWYFLALCRHRLHDERRATEAFEQAVYWHDTHEHELDGPARRELAAIRAEVAAILGLPREDRDKMDHHQVAEPRGVDPP